MTTTRVLRVRMMAILCAVVAVQTACGAPDAGKEESDDPVLGQSTQGLTLDRTVRVTPWVTVGGKLVEGKAKNIRMDDQSGTPDPDFASFMTFVGSMCLQELNKAIAQGASSCSWTNSSSMTTCAGNSFPSQVTNGSGVGEPVYAACIGHQFLTFSEATSSLFLINSQSDGPVIRNSPPVVGSTDTVSFRIDPSSPSDRASWALAATQVFREASESASWYLTSANCPANVFKLSCSGGTTRDFAEMIAASLLDSLSSSVEAAEKASKYLHASAQAKHATKGDARKARSVAWRDPYDSLLRAASAYVTIPAGLYNTPTSDGAYPVVTALVTTDGDRQAEELIRRHRVDPRVSRALIANRIVASLNAANGNAFSSWTNNGLGYLATLSISEQDVDRAAKRLVQESLVLGRPLKAFTESGVERVYGIVKSREPVNPAYLYAISETASYPSNDGTTPSLNYARKGIYHAMDFFVSKVPAIALRADLSQKTRRMLDSASAYASSMVGGRLHVASSGTTSLTNPSVRIIEHGAAPHASNPSATVQAQLRADYSAKYDIWLGEDGLLCALRGLGRDGNPCTPSDFQFKEGTANITFDTTSTDPGLLYPMFNLRSSTDTPGGITYLDQNGAFVPPRIYVTKVITLTDASGVSRTQNVLLGGFALNLPNSASVKRFFVPISKGLAEALGNTLAVDPLAADETSRLCGKGGLPRNVKVGLEDELLQAQGVNSSNTVDESWTYYLGLAKSAAEEADMLGSELVDRGLEMDMRAEDAREELEGLCGGVINVGDLRDRVCPPHDTAVAGDCDLMKFLQTSAAQSDETLVQLRQCLGNEPTVDATLGSEAVCSWQVKDLPPCMCPSKTKDLAGWQSCPGREYEANEVASWSRDGAPPSRSCTAPLVAISKPTTQDCERLFVPPTGSPTAGGGSDPAHPNLLYPSFVKFTVHDQTLNLVPQLKRSPAAQNSCADLARMREGSFAWKPDGERLYGKNVGTTTFKPVAQRLGVSRDWLNFVTVTRDGLPWLSTGRTVVADPNPWRARSDFPCAPMPGINCSGTGRKSILCSLSCGANSAADNDRTMVEGRVRVGERLARAVELLRVVTGSPLDGIEVAVPSELFKTLIPDKNTSCGEQERGGFGVPNWTDLDIGSGVRIFKESGWFAGNVDCDMRAYAEDPERHPRNPQYCSSLKTTSSDGGCSGMILDLPRFDGYSLANQVHAMALESPWLATRVRRDAMPLFEQASYPFEKVGLSTSCVKVSPSNHPRPEVSAITPTCTQGTSTNMVFFDAGGIVTWPTATRLALDAFWVKLVNEGWLAQSAVDITLQPRAALAFGDGPILRYWPALSSFNDSDLLDALELACVAEHPAFELGQDCYDPNTPAPKGVDDVVRIGGILACRARQVQEATSAMGLADVPAMLAKQMKDKTTVNIHPTFGGAYAQSTNKLYGALQRIAALQTEVASQTAAAGLELQLLRAQLVEAKYKKKASVESASAQIASLYSECSFAQRDNLLAQGGLVLSSWQQMAGSPYTSALTLADTTLSAIRGQQSVEHLCSRARAQEKRANALSFLEGEAVDAQIKQYVISAADSALKHYEAVETTWSGLIAAYGDAQAAVAELASQRDAARRAAAKLLMLDNDDVGEKYVVNSVMRARFSTLRVRYERAREYAIRMAYLARRAIEQKIGFNLATMEESVGWIDAPRAWADTICALEGIDYGKIRSGDEQAQQETSTGIQYDYANQYVGDYVHRLSEFMTAYVTSFASSSGQDVALVSMRDEIVGARDRACDVPGVNELLHTYRATEGESLEGGIPIAETGEDSEVVWEETCTAAGVCAEIVRTEESPLAAYSVDADGNGTPAAAVAGASDEPTFGSLGNVVKGVRLQTTSSSTDARIVTEQALYRQQTNLAPGTYLLSWYEPSRVGTTAPYLTPVIQGSVDGLVPLQFGTGSPLTPGQDRWLATGWVRHWGTFTTGGDVAVGWAIPSEGAPDNGFLFAAPQLERAESSQAQSVGPSQFAPTDDDYLAPVGICEDRAGTTFRAENWAYGCEVYCPASSGPDCASAVTDPSKLPKRCFHELKFHISQEETERGLLIPQGGFAAGNFNYRWEQLALNVVGTGIKDCATSETPSTCYANSFLQYSLRHDGPFVVRNYLGRDYEAPIYPGRIQQGKALLAERYLTNPISDADKSLLGDFWDHEFVGRPLDGSYTLRIYETDGLDWSAVEDIQLVMHYRYWTRLD